MPFGLAEAAAIAGGLTVGLRLGSSQAFSHAEGGEPIMEPGFNTTAVSDQRATDTKMTMTVMMVGESGVGKTLLCSRITHIDGPGRETLAKTLTPTWQPVDLDVDQSKVCFQILDTPGRPGLKPLCAPFCRPVDAVVMVFDVSNPASFDALKYSWLDDVMQHRLGNSQRLDGTCIVLANVIDERRERQVRRVDASSWCLENDLPYFETHPLDQTAWKRMLAHLFKKCIQASRDS